jgi:hypothetical protein
MLHLGLVEIETLYHLIDGYNILFLWEKFEPIIKEQRRFYDKPDWFIWWEHLALEISNYRVKRARADKKQTDTDIHAITRRKIRPRRT